MSLFPETVDETLDRLEAAFAAREGEVQAFLPEPNRFARLRVEAAELEERFPGAKPPLFGVPVGIKDIFHVDGFETRGGSRLPPSVLAGPEAVSVTQLKEAGALIVGKTVSTEFAYFAPGPTRNPHDLERTPGGSSSGSAAAVAAGLCDLALGTQTIGSICRPASYCGVIGFKPSYGMVSTEGVIPLAQSLDHVGWFTRDLQLSELAMAVFRADWSAEVIHRDRPVLGVPRGPYLEHAASGGAVFRGFSESLARDHGLEVRAVDAFLDFDAIASRHRRLVAAECAANHEEWFQHFGELYDSRTADLIRDGQTVGAAELAEARAGRKKLRSELHALMDEHELDVWISPASPGPAPRGLDSTGDPVMNLPWTHAGLPTLSVPLMASPEGLPMGLQISARFGQDTWAFWAAEQLRGLLA